MGKLFITNDSYSKNLYYKKIKVDEFLNDYIDVNRFLKCCKKCGNFNNRWSCPPYEFDVIDYWKRYKYLHLIGYQIEFNKDIVEKTYNEDELNDFIKDLFKNHMKFLYEKTSFLEERYKNSVSLAWGKCYKCEKCTRIDLKECRYKEDLRYSIESLGGNVDKLIEDFFDIKLRWAQNGKLPPYYFTLIGLLTKNDENLSKDDI